MRQLTISEKEEGQRLDKWLAKYMEKAPKSFFYKMMRKKNIVINGKKVQGNEKLKEGDSVSPVSYTHLDVYKRQAEDCPYKKGFVLIGVDGYPLGWAKIVNGTLRNKYYAGWRIQ